MAQERMEYVIAYDVRDDRSRVKLSELLLDYGERVQRSVFEASLNDEEVKEILARAENLVAEQDSLRLYPRCRACARRTGGKGRAKAPGPGGCVIV